LHLGIFEQSEKNDFFSKLLVLRFRNKLNKLNRFLTALAI
jgi:hypothetical protein